MPLPSLLGAPDSGIDSAAHIIQTALTPVFLLSGIGTLLGVYNTRLARVADQLEHATELLEGAQDDDGQRRFERHRRRYARRAVVLDASVAFGAVGGAATCGSVFFLFYGSLRGSEIAGRLLGLFGLALGCTIVSLVAFLVDSLLAWHGLRREGPLPRVAK